MAWGFNIHVLYSSNHPNRYWSPSATWLGGDIIITRTIKHHSVLPGMGYKRLGFRIGLSFLSSIIYYSRFRAIWAHLKNPRKTSLGFSINWELASSIWNIACITMFRSLPLLTLSLSSQIVLIFPQCTLDYPGYYIWWASPQSIYIDDNHLISQPGRTPNVLLHQKLGYYSTFLFSDLQWFCLSPKTTSLHWRTNS